MNTHILASGPELQAVRFGYVILGKNVREKKYLTLVIKLWTLEGGERISAGKKMAMPKSPPSNFLNFVSRVKHFLWHTSELNSTYRTNFMSG